MTYYKDFNKEPKDLLTKNFQDAAKWKVESKFKGPKDTVYVNPQASNDGVNVDVEYNLSSCPTKLKLNVNPDLKAKLTTTYEGFGKLEASVTDALDYEVSFENKFGDISVNDKLTKKAFEAGLAFAAAKFCSVGAGIVYNLEKSALAWSAGARYSQKGLIVDVVTNNLQTYTTGVQVQQKVAGKDLTVAAQVDCGKGFKGTVGVEMACILCAKNTVRIRVDNSMKWALVYIAKLSDNWKAAVSVDAKLKPGVLLTRE
jgi:hypothetical protein